jgi:hypothetical protein
MCSRLIVRRCLDGLVFFLANVSAKNRHFISYHHAVSALTKVGPAAQKSHWEDTFFRQVASNPSFLSENSEW